MIAVLTADLINSTQFEESILEDILNSLKTEFNLISEELKNQHFRISIYRGDSFQGELENPEKALEIVLKIKSAINKIHVQKTAKHKAFSKIADFKIAIGIGKKELERESVAESNGQAYQLSGRTLDSMKNENRKTKLQTPSEEINDEFDASFYLLDTITDRWSTASAEVVYYLLQGMKEREIADEIGISQSAVNQRKKAAGWEAIEVLLKRYEAVIQKTYSNGN